MEEENNKVESSLRHEKYKYEQQIAQMEKRKTDILNELNRRYEDLQMKEAEQKDENTQTMKKMELNHLQCMEELQTLYEKKLAFENQNFKRLDKEKGDMMSEYEGELKLLKKQNEDAIDKLLLEFKNNLGKIQEEYEDQKRVSDGLKTQYEEKLVQTGDEHEAELGEMKNLNKSERDQLNEVILTLKNDIETIKRQIKRIEEEKHDFEVLKKKALDKEAALRLILESEKMVIIRELEEAKKEVQDRLKIKEKELYKYKFKIKDLQKTKQVLTHRTQEMKASLEPKEQQIENLKEQLLELEQVFEMQTKAMDGLKADVDRRENKILDLAIQMKDEKTKTKEKENVVQSFVNKVHETAQNKNDERMYIKGLMEIYETFVKKYSDEILEKKKKDPETIEELDRQLKYMEKSIGSLRQMTTKAESRTKSSIKKRTKENTELINELNELRKSKLKLESQLEAETLRLQKLALDKTRLSRDMTSKKHSSQATYSAHGPSSGRESMEGLPTKSQQQFYTRPKSGVDDGTMPSLLNARGKSYSF